MIEYLESVQVGDFGDMTAAEVQTEVIHRELSNPDDYINPTLVMPMPPPVQKCDCQDTECETCNAQTNWWKHYEEET